VLAPASTLCFGSAKEYSDRDLGNHTHLHIERSVTATTNELTAPRRGLVAALRHSISRDQFFAGLFIVGCANGILGRILLAFDSDGWIGVLGGNISAIVWFACFAGVALMLRENRGELRSTDLAVGAVFLILVMLPIVSLSWVAVTGLSLYILLFANGGSERRRGALILLALTVPMLWSGMIFRFFAIPLLKFDAALAAWILGTDRVGNMFRFADGSGQVVVLPACSSFANMSLAFLCWITITQWVRHPWSSMDIFWSLLACTSVIAVNVIRISLMGLSPWHHDLIHNDWGNMVVNFIILGLTVAFSVAGARREIFSRI
jgi:hypothetical protein